MSNRYPGGFITAAEPDVSVSSADGVWTLTQQADYLSNNQWPFPYYTISRSLRFNSADTAYLSRIPGSSGNRRLFTLSLWTKIGYIGSAQKILFTSTDNATDTSWIFFNVVSGAGGASALSYQEQEPTQTVTTSAVFRDPSAWYHIVVAVDTTQATDSNRVKIYVNGVQQTLSGTYPTQNSNSQFNASGFRHSIGAYWTGTLGPYDGYMSDFYWVDGQQLTPSSFGQTNSTTGVWEPIAYTGAYGTNGFYLNFSDNSGTTATTLGKDYSGNGNNFTPNNFSVTAGAGNDSLVDVPTSWGIDNGAGGEVRGNYCTLNPIGLGGGTLSNGNLNVSISSTTPAVGTFAMTTGKWYWEVTLTTSTNPRVGVFDIGSSNPADLGATAYGWAIINGPSRTYNNGSVTSYGSFVGSNGAVVMVAYDADTGRIWYGENGSWFASGNPATNSNPSQTSVTGKAIVPASSSGTGSNVHDFNFGQRPFAYTAPSGFKALCTQNLPTPTVVQGDDYFNTVLWTGNGASSRAITGVGFQPDWVWDKMRSDAYQHAIVDSVRGGNRVLHSNSTSAEDVNWQYGYVSSFDSDGFTIQAGSTSAENWNLNAATFVAWCWKANGTGVTNTAGSITSTVSANTTSGFSVVTFTAASGTSNFTVGHGLGATPSMVIVKSRSNGTAPWYVYHASLATNNYLRLNTTNAATSDTDQWGAGMTSTVIGLRAGYSTVASTDTVAYCFAAIPGYSAFGSYTGNGSTDGPFVYTGFRPAWILFKQSSASGNDWFIYDAVRNTYNVATARLEPNATTAELTNFNTLDMLSNGWKVRDSNSAWNDSGSTYIYAAFSQNPFKYSLAR